MPFPPRTLERLLPALYKRNYRVWRGRGRQYKDLFGETPKWENFLGRHFTSLPEEIKKMRADPAVGRMLDEWLRDLDKAMKQVWIDVRNGDRTSAVKNLRVMVDIIRRYAKQYPRDFNISWDEVESGFYAIGVNWQGSSYENAKLRAGNVNWDWLESNAGEGPMPSPTAVRPNAERGGSSVLTPIYFRQWFIYTSKETFHAVETRREWPRPDEARPLGPLTITVKNRPFSDRITRPHLAEHEVIGCASAVAGFFDMLKNPNAAALLHGVVREPATSIVQRVSQWLDESKIAVDKTHLEWHHALEEKEGREEEKLVDAQQFIDSLRRRPFVEALQDIPQAVQQMEGFQQQLQDPRIQGQLAASQRERDETQSRLDYLLAALAGGQVQRRQQQAQQQPPQQPQQPQSSQGQQPPPPPPSGGQTLTPKQRLNQQRATAGLPPIP